jgi:integrase
LFVSRDRFSAARQYAVSGIRTGTSQGRPARSHDLHHTGATLAAQTGALLADLMKRRGHSSVAAVHTRGQRARPGSRKGLSTPVGHGDAAGLPKRIMGG